MTAASSEFAFCTDEGAGEEDELDACARTRGVIEQTRAETSEQINSGPVKACDKRKGIFQFFYAVASVKSNDVQTAQNEIRSSNEAGCNSDLFR
jgi:hypothetical protein